MQSQFGSSWSMQLDIQTPGWRQVQVQTQLHKVKLWALCPMHIFLETLPSVSQLPSPWIYYMHAEKLCLHLPDRSEISPCLRPAPAAAQRLCAAVAEVGDTPAWGIRISSMISVWIYLIHMYVYIYILYIDIYWYILYVHTTPTVLTNIAVFIVVTALISNVPSG